MFLLIFQIAISAIGIALSLGTSLWILDVVFRTIEESETRINASLEAVQRTVLRATHKLGSDFLALITGALALLIQESIGTYPRMYKVSISLMFAINFFLASQLIGSDSKLQKVFGIVFFIMPVMSFFAAFLILVPQDESLSWIVDRSTEEIILMFYVTLSGLLTFVFAFLKNREIQH